MRCLHRYARRHAGVRILRKSPVYRGVAYGRGSWAVGENIGWGARRGGSARSVFHRWLHSPRHRATLLSRSFREVGAGRRHARRLFGHRHVTVWVASFGRP